MKTIADCGIDPKLVRGVIRQLGGRESLPDVVRHGADAGYPGFTYYSDTVAFFRRHREAIAALVASTSDDMGEESIGMVAGFRCLTDDRETRESIARCLYGGRLTDADTTTANALAWFALEEVARALHPEI